MVCFSWFTAGAQDCPFNIDFENGTFDGWTCYTGGVTGNGTNIISLTPSAPIHERHTMYRAGPVPELDPFGGFPVTCPNGSGYSIRLGNTSGGAEAEGVSYEFTIPANEDYYTLIYNYAVVFQDPDHQEFEQPRMEIEVLNLSDNTIIYCSSFTFIPYGSILPGFFQSTNPYGDTPVWCKDWTAVSINLDGHAGKSIRMTFKTADCTFRRHFGYAYIDVNSECSGTFTGAAFCPDDTVVNVVAPFGYANYTWFNNTFTQILGHNQILPLAPLPTPGTTIAVVLSPYAGYGCVDTLFARLVDTLTVTANAGRDTLSCNSTPVPIGSPPKPGLVYRWSPATGLNNPNIANPYAAPVVTTTYVVTTNHDGGGCIDTDTVIVRASLIDTSILLLGKPVYCLGTNDSAVLRVNLTDSIQWYRDDQPIIGATGTEYRVEFSGTYHALLFNSFGCSLPTARKTISIASIPEAAVSPMPFTQCLVGNRFNFTNSSTNAVGAMQYLWTLGDGQIRVSRDVSHTYNQAGVYPVKLLVSSNAVCVDSVEFTVTIHPNAVAEFTAQAICVNLPMQVVNNTADTLGSPIHYSWVFSNGATSTSHTPPAQVFTKPGVYNVSLSVYSDQCPNPINAMRRNIVVDEPRPAIRYDEKYAVIDYPLTLEARSFGTTAKWNPATYLDNPNSFTPVFRSSVDQVYTIDITTASGCLTVDTQSVKAVKKAEIHVPSAFTPNNDGRNDRLRPILMGIKELRYFRIYNRWGQLVYQSRSEQPGWDGTVNGTPQSSQAFVWVVEGIGVDNSYHQKKGTVVLMR